MTPYWKCVVCPYCGIKYVFRKWEKRAEWDRIGKQAPLHQACIKAQKEERKAQP